jgi:hypothetical protein
MIRLYYWSCPRCGKKGFTYRREFHCCSPSNPVRIRPATDDEMKKFEKDTEKSYEKCF